MNRAIHLYWFFNDAWELAKRNVLHIARDPDQISGLFIVPIVYTFLFNYVFGGAIDKSVLAQAGSDDYVNYVTVGNFVMNILFASIITCVGVAHDATQGIIDRFRSLPIHPTCIIIGYIMASMCRAIVIITVVSITGLVMGFWPTTHPIKWVLALIVLLIMTIAISSVMTFIGVASRSVEAAHQSAGLIILPLSMLSSALVPPQTMPPFLRIIAQYSPCTYAIEAIRSLLFATDFSNHISISLVWFASITTIALGLSTYTFAKPR